MLDAGMGATHVNKIVAGLGVPPLSPYTIKKQEREIGPIVEALAKESCKAVCKATKEKEIALSKETGSGIAASYNAGWQRRGSGRTYNSLLGHLSLVGYRTGKIIDYEVRIKSCKACENAAKKCEKPKPRDCRENWSASAKSMEADMAASMLKQHEENNSENVVRLVMDNDSTTTAKLRAEVKHEIDNIKDINHTKQFRNTFV